MDTMYHICRCLLLCYCKGCEDVIVLMSPLYDLINSHATCSNTQTKDGNYVMTLATTLSQPWPIKGNQFAPINQASPIITYTYTRYHN